MMIDLPAPVSPVIAVNPGAEFPLQILDQREVFDPKQTEERHAEKLRVESSPVCQMKLAHSEANSRLPRLALTFLGTGTSQGVPMIRCDCAVCRSTDPRDNRTRASIYLETPERAFVVDTGTDFRTQCLRENIWEVDAVDLHALAHGSHHGVRRSAALRRAARRADAGLRVGRNDGGSAAGLRVCLQGGESLARLFETGAAHYLRAVSR